MLAKFVLFLRDDSGATAIEYGLLAGLIGIALVASMSMVGDALNSLFGTGTGGPTDIISNAANTIP